MTHEEARDLLLHHSFRHENISHPKTERGFLGMLRHLTGALIEDNYHDIMKAIRVLHVELTNKRLDSEIMASLWTICHLGRMWAIDKNGMLRRNNLISQEQIELVDEWISSISYTVFCLLDGAGVDEAFNEYIEKEG
jgi:hypothetical protein